MNHSTITGQLHLNGQLVGDVAVHGWHGPWGFGEFEPRAAFAAFAPLFEEWARLMHDNPGRLSRDNADRLRAIENRMYALHGRMWLVQAREWRHMDIVNIDGAMIEWKEGWTEDGAPPGTPPAARPAGAEAS